MTHYLLPEYKIYHAMLQRCHNPNSRYYKHYGARGITVCDSWRESYHNFIEDMGYRPSPKHSLDRKDNDKGYSPENCRWATKQVQQINKRPARIGKSGVIGVNWDRRARSWKVRISITGDGRVKNLGRFKSFKEAVRARKEAEKQYYDPLLKEVA